MQNSVKIGPEFFAKIKLDYQNWRWATAREFLQNSFDCGSQNVHVLLQREGSNTRLTVTNDGEPMDQDTLTGKLLTLGGSGKNFIGTTGGFGVAKSLLYYSNLDYTIHTGPHLVTGQGAQYDLTETGHLPGTRSSVLVEGDEVDTLEGAFRRFAQLCQWSGTLKLNGERLETGLRKGHHRRDFDWCRIWTNQQHANQVVVRINGTPMFFRRTSFKGCVVVELTGSSGDRLTSNRDGLQYSYACELDDFLSNLAVDKRSALRERKAEYKRYEGERLRYEAKQPKAAGSLLELLVPAAALEQLQEDAEGTGLQLAAFVRGGDRPVRSGGIATQVASRKDVAVSIGPEFILKNTCGMETPDYYTPGPAFSDYSRKLALAWARVLVELHRILEKSADFSIGFCLDEETEAEAEQGVYGQVYYINPAVVVCQRDKPQCRSFRKRFTGAWQDRFELISVAVHEIVHGAYGLSSHDEEFSNKFTEVVTTVLANMSRLTPLFRG